MSDPQKIQFSHLHNHTQYSLLDGLSKIPELVKQAEETGVSGFAVTDHGNLLGLPEVLREQEKARERGVKIAQGCEFYVTENAQQKNKESGTYHLTVLAKDNEGLENLMKLSTRSYTEGFYGHPRIDLDMLSEHKKGLVILSGCLGGMVAQALKDGDKSRAMELVGRYQDIFKDDYFLEVMPLEIPEQRVVNAALTDMSKELGIPTVTTCDCHYLKKEHFHAHDTWLAIQTGALLDDPDRFRFSTNRAYFQTPQEVLQNSLDAGLDPASMSRTLDVMERISGYSLDRSLKMPTVPDAPERLRVQAYEGLAKKGLSNNPLYLERLNYELNVIKQLGFDSYFLLVQKIIQIAKDGDIPVGPGRGSAAGSLVVWTLGITDLDPIKNGLIFERFLNPARVSPPDIDLDIGTKGRGDVIKSIVAEYGKERVATIETLGLALDKMVFKDVLRTMGVPFAKANLATAGMVTLDEFIPSDDNEKTALVTAKVLNGTVRNLGTHAAGIVISPEPLYGRVPLMTSKVAEENGILQLQLDMKAVDEWGYIKVDVLGLKELDILKDLASRTGINPSQETFLRDPGTLAMIARGETTGVFQLGTSEGMKKMLKEMTCESFNDVCAALSLFRPGPLESGIVRQYIENKEHKKRGEQIPSLNPRTDSLLAETYGVPIYQEQIMEMGKLLAGFDMKEADLLRKAMGKKKPEEMAKMKTKWVKGCAANDIPEKEAVELFEKVEHFSGYGFNKSHSAAYAVTAMKMAWYKCHYPEHYWASKISHENDIETRGVMAEAAKREGVDIHAPRIYTENSGAKLPYADRCSVAVVGGKKVVEFGISDLKGVGEGVAEALTKDSEAKGPFFSMKDVYKRLLEKPEGGSPILNKRAMVALTSVGFFDPVFKDRGEILRWVDSKYKDPGKIPGLEAPAKRKGTRATTGKPLGQLFKDFDANSATVPDDRASGNLAELSISKGDHTDTTLSFGSLPEGENVLVPEQRGATKKPENQDKLNGEVSFSGTVLSNNRMAVDQVIRDYFMSQSGRDVCSSKDSLKKQPTGRKKNDVFLVGTLKEARHLVSKKTGNPFYMAQIILPVDAYPVTVFIWEDKWPEIEKTFKENKNKVVAIKGALSGEKDGWNYSVSLDEIYVPEKESSQIHKLGLEAKER